MAVPVRRKSCRPEPTVIPSEARDLDRGEILAPRPRSVAALGMTTPGRLLVWRHAADCFPYSAEQRLRVKRLLDERNVGPADDAAFQFTHVARHDCDREPRIRLANLIGKVDAVHAGHRDIREH